MVLVTSGISRERIYPKIARSSGNRLQKRSPALSKTKKFINNVGLKRHRTASQPGASMGFWMQRVNYGTKMTTF
jgi:hypothetical protein